MVYVYCSYIVLDLYNLQHHDQFVGSFNFYFIIFAFQYIDNANLNKTKRLHTRHATA